MENFILELFVKYPWLGPSFAALYFISEAMGANQKVKENAVYQMVMTFAGNIFGKFYTKVDKAE